MSTAYDLIIIGSGPAGYVGALRAAQLGGSVAVVEARELGGLCLNRGCIPTKCLVESAAVFQEVRRAEEMGIQVSSPAVNFTQVIARAQGVVERLRRGIQSLFRSAKVDLVEGRGRLLSADCVLVENGPAKQELRGRAVLIATGSEPARPGPLALASPRAITSDNLLHLTELPRRLLVVGAGVTGCEFACGFRQLGTEVTLVEMLDDILPVVDDDVRRGLLSSFRRNKVQVLTGTRVEKLADTGSAIVAELSQGGPIEADLALIATGRRFNVEGVGLEDVGVSLTGHRIVVDERGRTSVAGVWAAGDVAEGPWLLAHVAARQALVAVEDIFGVSGERRTDVVPFGIFTLPEVGSVGLTEAEARAAGREVSVGRFPFSALGRAVTAGRTEGFVKVVADSGSGELLGVHVLGPRAADLVHEAALAMENRLTVEALIRTIHAHPTFAEALQEAALDSVGRVLHLPRRGE